MRNGRIVDKFGDVRWYLNKELHRTGGPAVERVDGSCEWWLYGQLHREDGPAIEWANGSCFWYVNDQLHRTSGPAVEWATGDREWWLHDKYYSFAEWLKHLNTTPETRTLLIIKWSR